jgi:hypothetical protein
MRDPWTPIVSERLAALELPDDERNEVIEEVAAHLRECADEIEATGVADETDVADRVLAQVSDWPRLASQIRRAKELRMSATGVDLAYGRSSVASHRRLLASVVTITVLGGAASGFVTSWLTPVRYRSQAVIQVTPPQVSNEYVRTASTAPLDVRLRAITQTVLSRTRLEAILTELNLYSAERVSQPMQEVVEEFRRNVSIRPEAPAGQEATTDTFTVSYTGADPLSVMKVTERLASLMKAQSMREAETRAQGTTAFLESEAEDVGRRLQEHQARIAASHAPADRKSQMETQVLESTYVKLLTDMQSARMQVNLATRQIGEQLTLIDAARLPQLPVGPTRWQFIGFGALAGLSVGVLIALGVAIGRLWSSKRPQPLPQTA